MTELSLCTLQTKNEGGTTIASHDISYVDQGVYINGHKTQDVFWHKPGNPRQPRS